MKKIKSALVSVFHKDNLEKIIRQLNKLGVVLYSTGGTRDYIESLNIPVVPVEDLTQYPSILGGRVKTLHPKIFGGILSRRDNEQDRDQLDKYQIPEIDLVIVDLYPFEETVKSGADEAAIIEKIDIGGISLIRAAAKNYRDVLIVSSRSQYGKLESLLETKAGFSDLQDRKSFAADAFKISSGYDTAIHHYFTKEDGEPEGLKIESSPARELRYGENPHQKGTFYGDFDDMFEVLHGKEPSYNNLLDADAAVNLISDFYSGDPTFAILKHNNACGIATRKNLHEAYVDALAGDPVSAFGGVLISNRTIDLQTANLVNDLFCEIVIAPGFEKEALEVLKSRKNRIIMLLKHIQLPPVIVRSSLNGYLVQDRDLITDSKDKFTLATRREPTEEEKDDLVFASKIAKHSRSNSIILAKNGQLLGSGTGETSRVDALKHAIDKAKAFGFSLDGAVMASEAFFPFPDCVEIADKAGIRAVIQPGGSVKDQLSIEYCDQKNMAMVFTGTRHFKH